MRRRGAGAGSWSVGGATRSKSAAAAAHALWAPQATLYLIGTLCGSLGSNTTLERFDIGTTPALAAIVTTTAWPR